MSDLTEPPVFQAAVETVRSATVRSELVLTEIPAPSGLAPSAIAFAADVRPSSHGVDSVLGTGRFILLHDPEEPESWGGPFRIVCFAQAPLRRQFLGLVFGDWGPRRARHCLQRGSPSTGV